MEGPSLSPSGESAWQSLRQHIEWTPGFWIGWIFTDHTPSGREIVERAAVLLRDRGRRAEIRRLRAPEEFRALLGWLTGGADGIDGCVAVEVIRQSDAWIEAWEGFLLRLNERREALRASLRGGLLFVTPSALKAGSRAVAPDLWSIRSLALDVAPPAGSEDHLGSAAPAEEPGTGEARETQELVLAERALSAARQAGRLEPEIEAQLRRARALMAEGRGVEAREAAAMAVQRAPNVALEVQALEILAEIEEELGDLVAAERHFFAALERGPDVVSSHRLFRALREESSALIQVGDVLLAEGNVAAALACYRDSLEIVRRIRTSLGETADVINDEAECRSRIERALALLSATGHEPESSE